MKEKRFLKADFSYKYASYIFTSFASFSVQILQFSTVVILIIYFNCEILKLNDSFKLTHIKSITAFTEILKKIPKNSKENAGSTQLNAYFVNLFKMGLLVEL